MKKFLAFLITALMLLSVAVAEEPQPDPTSVPEEAAPSPTTQVEIVYEPSKEDVAVEGEVTRDLFAVNPDPAAVEMADLVLDMIDNANTPVDAFQSETQKKVLAALGVNAQDVKVSTAPIPMLVNDEVAKTVNGDQMLVLTNVPVNGKFIIVLSVQTGNEYTEVVLTEVDSDPVTLQVYAKVDKETLEILRKADLIIATVLTVV